MDARKRTEKGITLNDYQQVSKQVGLGVYSWDLESGELIWSDEIYSIYGLSPETPPGVDVVEQLILPEDRFLLREALDRTGELKTPPVLEFRIRRPDGQVRYIHSVAIPSYRSNRLVKMIGTVQDITLKKQLEEQLHQTEKLLAIGQLAGGIAHDFNNQLACIVGYADMLLDDSVSNADRISFAQEILTACSRASDLTGKLLTFARKGEHENLPVDVHAILEEVGLMIRRSLSKQIRLELHADAEDFRVLGDATQLQNAFLNLAINARDAMDNGGELTFSTRNVELDEEACSLRGEYLLPGKYIVVSVKDSGTGIEDSIRSQIFEPFFTTKEPGKGTGMGLAAVFGAVEMHNGFLELNSEPGEGSEFSLFLPLEILGSAAGEQGGGEFSGFSVFIVDEDLAYCRKVARILRHWGCEVTLCYNGTDALEQMADLRESNLVLIDLVLPDMRGEELMLKLREFKSDLKILLTTIITEPGDLEQLTSAGFSGILPKPYSTRKLKSIITEIIKS